MRSTVLVCSLVAALVALTFASPPPNSLTYLPGYDGPSLDQYTGYVTVDADHGRNLFYWLIKSLNEPDTDPLVVWYQGGPGCSGLGGLFSENGPFFIGEDGDPHFNDLTWVNNANVLYIEQPAGVGFSYSDDRADYNTNDTRAAEDNYAFLQGFLELFPEYVGRDLWLTGESYGGIYIPTLTAQILNGSDSSLADQLTGWMIGNGLNLCPELDVTSVQYNIFYWHGLVSPTNYANWTSYGCNDNANTPSCQSIFNIAYNQIGSVVQQLTPLDNEPSLDPDDLYQDFCTGNGTLEFAVDNTDNCSAVGDRVADYLNRPDVQAAIGAQPAIWIECTSNINYTLGDLNMNPIFLQAFAAGLNILVYTGDVDVATVPAWYTIPCLNALNQNLISDWQPWFVNEATAGYVQEFDTYTFATLKGAGHEAPQYQPLTAYNMYSRFLSGNWDLSDDEYAAKKAKLAYAKHAQKVLTQGSILRQITNRYMGRN